ncbi:DUF6338 family protein [Cohnella sp. GCM10012308]|uniref:DUF6338 family protein n=1 Tax=Cohnella sp. GCM10012308 TaxID=3317329 RepID=UPI00360FD37D
MDSFIGTLAFLLPGFMAYLWIQMFGINPVVKHSVPEVTAIAAILWLPVSIGSVLIFNLVGIATGGDLIWSLQAIKNNSGRLNFLISFLFISAVISFFLSYTYAKWVFPKQRILVNNVRKKIGVAGYSEYPSVWDEVFGRNESQVVRVSKIDKEKESGTVGQLQKVSRPFEPDKSICLDEVVYYSELISEYPNIVKVDRVFIDTKSGTRIEIFDLDSVMIAIGKKDGVTQ